VKIPDVILVGELARPRKRFSWRSRPAEKPVQSRFRTLHPSSAAQRWIGWSTCSLQPADPVTVQTQRQGLAGDLCPDPLPCAATPVAHAFGRVMAQEFMGQHTGCSQPDPEGQNSFRSIPSSRPAPVRHCRTLEKALAALGRRVPSASIEARSRSTRARRAQPPGSAASAERIAMAAFLATSTHTPRSFPSKLRRSRRTTWSVPTGSAGRGILARSIVPLTASSSALPPKASRHIDSSSHLGKVFEASPAFGT